MVYKISSPHYSKVWYFRTITNVAKQLYCETKQIQQYLNGSKHTIINRLQLKIEKISRDDFEYECEDFSKI